MLCRETLQICFVNLCRINFPVGGVRSLARWQDPVSVWWQQMVGLEAQRSWRYLQTLGNPRQQIHEETRIQFQMSRTPKSQPRVFKQTRRNPTCLLAGVLDSASLLTAEMIPLWQILCPFVLSGTAQQQQQQQVGLFFWRPTSQWAGFHVEQHPGVNWSSDLTPSNYWPCWHSVSSLNEHLEKPIHLHSELLVLETL